MPIRDGKYYILAPLDPDGAIELEVSKQEYERITNLRKPENRSRRSFEATMCQFCHKLTYPACSTEAEANDCPARGRT